MRQVWGKYIIPRKRLSILLDHLITIMKTYPSYTFSRDEFVKAIGLSHSSSGPDEKIVSMEQFGLITKDRFSNKYIVSELGKDVIVSHGNERIIAIEKVIRNIPLWDQLLKIVGTDVTNEKFVPAFKAITEVTDNEIVENLTQLKYAYTDDIACIQKNPPFSTWSIKVGKPRQTMIQKGLKYTVNSQKKPESPIIQEGAIFETQKIPQPIKWTFKLSSEMGNFQLEIYDKPTYNMALTLLQTIKNQIERRSEVPQMGS